jgi:phenylalanine-4-hydroxylase
VRDLDPLAMAATPYDINHYQPVLFGAQSLDEVLDVVGGFFATMTDDVVDRIPAG